MFVVSWLLSACDVVVVFLCSGLRVCCAVFGCCDCFVWWRVVMFCVAICCLMLLWLCFVCSRVCVCVVVSVFVVIVVVCVFVACDGLFWL